MNAPVATLKTAAETELAKQFAGITGGLQEMRAEAFRRFDAAGLPHRRIEAWHYTDLRSMMRSALPRAEAPASDIASSRPWSLLSDDRVFAFVDGYLTQTPQLPKGVSIQTLATHPTGVAAALNRGVDLSGDIVTSLNTAFMVSGLVIDVAPDADVKQPLALAFLTTGATASYGRVVVNVADGASVTIVETHRGAAGAQSNTVVEFVLGKGATAHHVRVNAADAAAQTLSTVAASIAAHATFNSLSLTSGAALSRHQVFTRLHGDHARIGLGGVTLIRGEQHADTTLETEHDSVHGVGRKLFKTIVDDTARGVFQGRIVVKPHAQKTDGKMSSNALLLGEHAQMHAKPELEIFADDVVCGHGATVGALDHDLLFYLMSRGIGRKEAEGLMIQAFAGEALEMVEHEGLREALGGLVEGWLTGRT
ncbi:MAG: Fe-S cluster assembly protein SufD [Beijerinckiaceae bacterium]